jgi:hypothetical protein
VQFLHFYHYSTLLELYMQRRHLLGHAVALTALASGARAQSAARPVRRLPAQNMQVELVQMPAWTERAGQRVPLAPGDGITSAQDVQTGEGGALAFRLPDGSLIRLGEKTRLNVLQLRASDNQGQLAVTSEMKLFDGFFRFVTGAAAKVAGQRQINVQLRTATIGIRGTDFWTMTDTEHDAACLFEGHIALDTRDQGLLELAQPTAFWARFFDKPVAPVGQATPAQLSKFLASTDAQAGQGIAVVDGRWQVVAFSSKDSRQALQIAARLRGAGYPAQLLSHHSEHLVLIRQLASEADAKMIQSKLNALLQSSDSRVQMAL